MAVKKLDWAVSYTSASGKRLRNEYDTEARAREFAARQEIRAMELSLDVPSVVKLKPRRWEAGFQDHQGRWKTKRFATKDEANEFLNGQLRAVRTGTYVDPKYAAGMSVGALFESWIERVRSVGASGRRAATPKTVQGYEWLYTRMIKPYWEDYPLSNVTYEGVAEWTRKMIGVNGGVASADTRARATKQFSRMLDHAVAIKVLRINPAKDSVGGRDYVPSAGDHRESVYLTRPQLERLAAFAGTHELMIRFTGLTGLRWGEVTALTVEDLDLGSRPYVSVNKAYSEVKGKLILGSTKGHASRDVPLPASLVADLSRLVVGKGPGALLFPSAEGHAMRNSNFTRRYYQPARLLAAGCVARVQTALGVSESRRGLAVFGDSMLTAVLDFQQSSGLEIRPMVGKDMWLALAECVPDSRRQSMLDSARISLVLGDSDFRPPVFHDLRHTAVSLYLAVTKNVKHVQRIAGHKDATTTLNTYAELFEDDFYSAAAGLDKLIAS
ncbi:tyrosine-type recombinase/integrase [Arthrobacter sp. SAFR-044]|uniref:tyrosine-type recombinase/integrase n=1 Tax=Arthrobacter sp. SAFR-044 TaxID=3387278 RepID=UPI003F7B8F68